MHINQMKWTHTRHGCGAGDWYFCRMTAEYLHVLFAEQTGQVLVEMIDNLVAVVYQKDVDKVMLLCLEFGHCFEQRLTSDVRREAPVYAGNSNRRQLPVGGEFERLRHCRKKMVDFVVVSSLPRSDDSVDDVRTCLQLSGFRYKRVSCDWFETRLHHGRTFVFNALTS